MEEDQAQMQAGNSQTKWTALQAAATVLLVVSLFIGIPELYQIEQLQDKSIKEGFERLGWFMFGMIPAGILCLLSIFISLVSLARRRHWIWSSSVLAIALAFLIILLVRNNS